MILTVTLNAAIDKRYVVENFRLGEVNRVKECAYTPGGKGLNVSKPAAIAGEEVVATGFVGGHAGNYIQTGYNQVNDGNEQCNQDGPIAGDSADFCVVLFQIGRVQTGIYDLGA